MKTRPAIPLWWLLLIFGGTLALCVMSVSCGTPYQRQLDKHKEGRGIIIDVSSKTLKYKGKTIPIETGRRGVGNTYGSKKTPLGTFIIYEKQERHRFSKGRVGVMRLKDPEKAGKTKHEPGARGVHIHRNLDGKPNGTNGCFCPLYDSDMTELWESVPEGTQVTVKL